MTNNFFLFYFIYFIYFFTVATNSATMVYKGLQNNLKLFVSCHEWCSNCYFASRKLCFSFAVSHI